METKNTALKLFTTVKENNKYRVTLLTTTGMEQVMMSVPKEVPMETHENSDQFILVVQGHAKVTIGTFNYELFAGDSATVPMGINHRILNLEPAPAKIFTIYTPPET